MVGIGIVGASGFTGAELLRLAAQHPDLDVQLATGDTQAGTRAAELYPSLAAAYPSLMFTSYDATVLAGLDLVFLGLPHGASQAIVPELIGKVGHLVDLAADFRLQDPSLYPQWYGEAHTAPELLPDFAYGLPELFRDEIAGKAHVAVPGCYPTAASLALAPLVRAGAIETSGIIVDAASGVSGAGRPPKPNTSFCTVDEDFTAYGLLDHRHTPEIEQVIGAMMGEPPGEPSNSTAPSLLTAATTSTGSRGPNVLFTPHLAPMNRGILATCYARPTGPTSSEAVLELLRTTYAGEPFVVVIDGSPSTKATLGSNCAHVTARYDERTGWVVALCAIDNITKGASGQAVQCANLVLDLPETTGLPIAGVYP